MSLKEKIQQSVTAAMKAREAARLQTLRNIWNAIRKKEIDERKDLTDAEVEKTILTQIKQIQESLEQARGAGRSEAVAENEAELLIMKEFLPQALSENEVQNIVVTLMNQLKAAGTLPEGAAAIGLLMKSAMSEIGARSEGKLVQSAVRKALGMG